MDDAAAVQNFREADLQFLTIGGECFKGRGFIENAQAFLGGSKAHGMGGVGAAMAAPPYLKVRMTFSLPATMAMG